MNTLATCEACEGRGEIPMRAARDEDGVWDADWEHCWECDGRGETHVPMHCVHCLSTAVWVSLFAGTSYCCRSAQTL